MSKSLGNFYTLRDIVAKGYAPVFVRYVLLATHYRQQLNFTLLSLDAAKNSLQRLWDFVQKLDEANAAEDMPKVDTLIVNVKHAFEKALDNDLEISEALAVLFVFIKHVNVLLRSKKVSANDAKRIKTTMFEFDKVLGVIQKPDEEIPDEIHALVKERDAARALKNFARSDNIREELQKRGFVLEDTPEGTRVKKIM